MLEYFSSLSFFGLSRNVHAGVCDITEKDVKLRTTNSSQFKFTRKQYDRLSEIYPLLYTLYNIIAFC